MVQNTKKSTWRSECITKISLRDEEIRYRAYGSKTNIYREKNCKKKLRTLSNAKFVKLGLW